MNEVTESRLGNRPVSNQTSVNQRRGEGLKARWCFDFLVSGTGRDNWQREPEAYPDEAGGGIGYINAGGENDDRRRSV